MFECYEDSDWTQWVAVKDDKQFYAESPEALLGLINLYELLGEDESPYTVTALMRFVQQKNRN